MMGNQPVFILQEGTRRERGRDAQSNNILAARAIADAVRSTLGPRGMDKMLVDSMGDVVITNDGATILKEIDVQHPAAKMVIEVSQTQDEEVGDGTTTAVVLAGELLKRAEDLVEDVHPTLITRGYNLATQKAAEVLAGIAQDVSVEDDKTLRLVATTAMNSKSAGNYSDLLSDIVVRAVKAVADTTDRGTEVDHENIQVVKKTGGSVEDTELIEGVILDKDRVHAGMPQRVEDARIALLDTPLEVKKTEVDAEIQITDPTQLQSFLQEEEGMLRKMVDTLQDAGANVVFCQKGIDDLAQHFLAKAGIYAIRRVKKSDMAKLERATGARIVSSLPDLTEDDLGDAGTVEERTVAGDQLTFVTECPDSRAVSVLVRGGTDHVVDEVERTLDDSLGVVATTLEDGQVVAGGGAPEIEVALRLREYAASVGGREQLAIEAFADAVEIIPRTLAENAGLDAIETLVSLRNAHEGGNARAGVDVDTGEVEDMWDHAVIEPLRVKTQALSSATEVSTLILRIDDVIASKGFKGGDGGDDMDMDF